MSVTSSRRHQFTLSQLLVTLTAICALLALVTPSLRRTITHFGYYSLFLVPPLLFLLFFALVVIRLSRSAVRADHAPLAVRAEAHSHGIGWLGLLAYLCIVVPEGERVFRQLDMWVPAGGRWVLKVSNAATAQTRTAE